jgi:hypothetical protein
MVGWVVLGAALNLGTVGDAALSTLFLTGAGVLWNGDSLASAWREDVARQRERP